MHSDEEFVTLRLSRSAVNLIDFLRLLLFFSEKFKADIRKQIHDYLTEKEVDKREDETSEKTEFITKNIRKGYEWKGGGGGGEEKVHGWRRGSIDS